MNNESNLVWLRLVNAGTDNECWFVCNRCDPGAIPFIPESEITRPAEVGGDGWLPIESAPRDGTRIIGCAMQAPKFVPEHVGMYWATDAKQKFWTDGEWRVRLTHYIPTPPTPGSEAKS